MEEVDETEAAPQVDSLLFISSLLLPVRPTPRKLDNGVEGESGRRAIGSPIASLESLEQIESRASPHSSNPSSCKLADSRFRLMVSIAVSTRRC